MKKNQAGFSLVMALVGLAIVTSGTFYIMELKKEDQRTYALTKNLTYTEQEKKRISTILSDSANCTSAFNSKSANATWNTLSLSTATGNFLNVGTGANALYYKTLQLVQLQTRQLSATSGQIILTYKNDSTQHSMAYVGKSTSSIVIPLYMNISGGNITDCYATTTNAQLPTIISAACGVTPNAPTYPDTFNYAYMTKDSTGTTVASCVRETMLGASTANGATINCAVGTGITGFNLTTVAGSTGGQRIEIPSCSAPVQACGGTTKMYSYVNSAIGCDNVGAGAHDSGSCSVHQGTWWTSSSTVACASMDCSSGGTYNMIRQIYPLICYQAPSNSCPAGQYVKIYYSDGTVQCDTMPVISGNCAPGFATYIARNTGGSGSFTCTAYTKSKTCASPSITTYVQSFNTSTTANCSAPF